MQSKINKVLFLISLEGKVNIDGKKTVEDRLFTSLINEHSEFIKLSCHNISPKSLSNIKYVDSAQIDDYINKFYNSANVDKEKLFIECYIFSDGDLEWKDKNSWESVINTKNLFQQYLKDKYNIDSEFKYDKSLSIEFFFWIVIGKYNPELVNKHEPKNLTTIINTDICKFYNVSGLKEFKKQETNYWKPLRLLFSDNDEKIEIVECATKIVNKYGNGLSIYLFLIERVLEYIKLSNEFWENLN